jgi:hypothetical protein
MYNMNKRKLGSSGNVTYVPSPKVYPSVMREYEETPMGKFLVRSGLKYGPIVVNENPLDLKSI